MDIAYIKIKPQFDLKNFQKEMNKVADSFGNSLKKNLEQVSKFREQLEKNEKNRKEIVKKQEQIGFDLDKKDINLYRGMLETFIRDIIGNTKNKNIDNDIDYIEKMSNDRMVFQKMTGGDLFNSELIRRFAKTSGARNPITFFSKFFDTLENARLNKEDKDYDPLLAEFTKYNNDEALFKFMETLQNMDTHERNKAIEKTFNGVYGDNANKMLALMPRINEIIDGLKNQYGGRENANKIMGQTKENIIDFNQEKTMLEFKKQYEYEIQYTKKVFDQKIKVLEEQQNKNLDFLTEAGLTKVLQSRENWVGFGYEMKKLMESILPSGQRRAELNNYITKKENGTLTSKDIDNFTKTFKGERTIADNL